MESERRHFLTAAAVLGLGTLTPAVGRLRADDKKDEKKPDEDISATEDLMREHGVLNRILLIYEEGLRRLHKNEEVTPEVFHKPASLVRKFIEEYHEQLEEKYIFPEFEKRNKHLDLVKVLKEQHQAGRKVTDVVLRIAVPDRFSKKDDRAEMVRACEAFIRMYRPHEAREDTVLFPAVHQIVPAAKLKELGEQFEKEEDRLFGDEGFEKTVNEVAGIEKQLGIYNLAQFTPR